jgi:hypothetical protein
LTSDDDLVIQPKSPGLLYAERNFAIASVAFDNAPYVIWTWQEAPLDWFAYIITLFSFNEGSPSANATIYTYLESGTLTTPVYGTYNATALKPTLGQDVERALGKWVNIQMRFISLVNIDD